MAILPIQKFDYIEYSMEDVLAVFQAKDLYPGVLTHQAVCELYRQLFDRMEYNFERYMGHVRTLPNFTHLVLNHDTPELRNMLSVLLPVAGLMAYNLCREHHHFHPDEPDTYPYFLEHVLPHRCIMRAGYDFANNPGKHDV